MLTDEDSPELAEMDDYKVSRPMHLLETKEQDDCSDSDSFDWDSLL